MPLSIHVCIWVSLKRNNSFIEEKQPASYLIICLILRKFHVQPSVWVNWIKLDKTGNAEGGIANQGYRDRWSVSISIFIHLRKNRFKCFDCDVTRALNFRVNSLKRLKKPFRLHGFSSFINAVAEVSKKAGMCQRPLSGAIFVVIKEKHANAV